MIQVDFAGLEEQLENAFTQNKLGYLLVFDNDKQIVINIGNAPKPDTLFKDTVPRLIDDDRYDISNEIKIAELELGEIWLGVSLLPVKQAINKSINRNVIAAVSGIALNSFIKQLGVLTVVFFV